MRAFAETFFLHFGAQLQFHEEELIVDLPPELIPVFGKPRLYLVFPDASGKTQELSPVEDLLVYGSRIFDQMLGLLAGRGETACLYFPEGEAPEPETQAAVPLPLQGCRLLSCQVQASREQFYLFNFRAAYLSDEKQEELITVVLDAGGQEVPGVQSLLDGLGHEITPLDHPTRIEVGALRHLSLEAGQRAQQQLQPRLSGLEQALKSRLEKVLLRLTSYYRRLLAEVNSGDPLQDETLRADLQQDLSHKIGEELERHRLKVTLTPVSLAVASIPLLRYHLHLATDHTQQKLHLVREQVLGQLEPLSCHHCHEILAYLALCDRGHLVHQGCSTLCQRCGRTICHTCGVANCVICGDFVCVDCHAACDSCEDWVCAQHIGSCAICGAAYCPNHSFRCRWCQQSYCHRCGQESCCETCRAALAAPLEKITDLPAVAGLPPARFEWQQAENKNFSIFIGHRKRLAALGGRRQVILVLNKAGEVINWRKRGWLAWLLGWE